MPRPPVPPVPPGPGVRPPFAGPPVEKEAGTLALGLILGGLVLLLCLVGGGVGLGGAVVTAFQETDEQAREVAADYLDAIADERYDDAYRMTCKPFRKKVDEREYVVTKRRGERVVDYELRSIQALDDGRLVVPARLHLESGRRQTVDLVMAWESPSASPRGPGPPRANPDAASRFRVCGEVDRPAPRPS